MDTSRLLSHSGVSVYLIVRLTSPLPHSNSPLSVTTSPFHTRYIPTHNVYITPEFHGMGHGRIRSKGFRRCPSTLVRAGTLMALNPFDTCNQLVLYQQPSAAQFRVQEHLQAYSDQILQSGPRPNDHSLMSAGNVSIQSTPATPSVYPGDEQSTAHSWSDLPHFTLTTGFTLKSYQKRDVCKMREEIGGTGSGTLLCLDMGYPISFSNV